MNNIFEIDLKGRRMGQLKTTHSKGRCYNFLSLSFFFTLKPLGQCNYDTKRKRKEKMYLKIEKIGDGSGG